MQKSAGTYPEQMNIGILTYHRSHNYGALLQAIGLRRYLEEKGHKAYFIDYWPDYHNKMYVHIPSLHAAGLSLRGRISGFIQDILLYPLRHRRIDAFRRFIDRNINPYSLPASETFDCIICGSDQIWRKQKSLEGRYNPVYFGGGETKAGRRISYAGSMGSVSIPEEDKETLKRLFSNFQAISVREDKLAALLSAEGIVKDVEVVVDPTVLLGAGKWKEIIEDTPSQVKGKYALYYKLMYDCFDEDSIKEFAKSRGLKLVILEGNVRREDWMNGSITDADPLEMLRLIADAEYVFTSSYHGLAFSLLFRRQMVCAFKENKDRARSLLSSLGIPERLIEKGQPIPTIPIDYDSVVPRLDSLAKASHIWLDNNLQDPDKSESGTIISI